MKNTKGTGAVVKRLLRTIREFYPVMLPVTIVCIVINAVVSSLPSIFMQNIIEVIENTGSPATGAQPEARSSALS